MRATGIAAEMLGHNFCGLRYIPLSPIGPVEMLGKFAGFVCLASMIVTSPAYSQMFRRGGGLRGLFQRSSPTNMRAVPQGMKLNTPQVTANVPRSGVLPGLMPQARPMPQYSQAMPTYSGTQKQSFYPPTSRQNGYQVQPNERQSPPIVKQPNVPQPNVRQSQSLTGSNVANETRLAIPPIPDPQKVPQSVVQAVRPAVPQMIPQSASRQTAASVIPPPARHPESRLERGEALTSADPVKSPDLSPVREPVSAPKRGNF